jgi:hypothetical protein
MHSRRFRILPLLAAASGALCLSPSTVHSAEQRIQCPPTLEPDAIQGKAPAGWRFAMPQAAQLTAAGMLHGPPEESGYLVPAESKDSRQGWTQRWNFEPPHWYPTFVYCGYGGGGLQLFYPIPKDATQCVATGRKKGGAIEQVAFVCR